MQDRHRHSTEFQQDQSLNKPIVSVKQQIVQPNDLLPGKLLRSQMPNHIISKVQDFVATPGFQMLLDNSHSTENVSIDKQNKQKYRQEKNLNQNQVDKKLSKSTSNKKKSYSESTIPKLSKKITIIQKKQEEPNDTNLGFLEGSLTNIFNFAESIIFVSSLAFQNVIFSKGTKGNQLNSQMLAKQNQKNEQIIKHIERNRYFGSIPYLLESQMSENLRKDSNKHEFQQKDQFLEFQDQFQSSNIYLALRHPSQTIHKEQYLASYYICSRLDFNTKSYGQWFYFQIHRKSQQFSFNRNSKNNVFKFEVINLTKRSSLFGKGLKISVCRKGVWRKEGGNIKYMKNSLRRDEMERAMKQSQMKVQSVKKLQHFFSLEFDLEIAEGETILVAYNEPYTYTRMGQLLDSITQSYELKQYQTSISYKRSVLCTTPLNNRIDILSFTAKHSTEFNNHPEKPVIFVVARTHPIQSAGSHVIQGILNMLHQNFIQEKSQKTEKEEKIEKEISLIYHLMQNYVIKIIPMINPDGVILGNSRCNLNGFDLNRIWKNPSLESSTQIFHLKKYILQYGSRVKMFLDLHAHSKKKNVFAYGCHDISNPFATRQFPYLLSKLSKNDFLFQECQFTKPLRSHQLKNSSSVNVKCKSGTARLFLWEALKIHNIFTIENSYCSAEDSIFHYDTSAYQVVGRDILKAIAIYFSPSFKKQQSQLILNQKLLPEKHSNHEANQQESNANKQERNQLTLNQSSSFSEAISIQFSINQHSSFNQTETFDLVNSFRQRIITQLHSNQQNVTMGLIHQNQLSESEEEQRTYFKSPIKNKDRSVIRLNQGSNSKTQKLLKFLNKNLNSHHKTISHDDQQVVANEGVSKKASYKFKYPLKTKEQLRERKQSKVHDMKESRSNTCTIHDEEMGEKEKQLEKRRVVTKEVLSMRWKKARFETESETKIKRGNFLSIVEVGVDKFAENFSTLKQQSSLKINFLKNHTNPQAKTERAGLKDSSMQEDILAQEIKLQKFRINFNHEKKREEEIKEYMRKLARIQIKNTEISETKKDSHLISKAHISSLQSVNHSNSDFYKKEKVHPKFLEARKIDFLQK